MKALVRSRNLAKFYAELAKAEKAINNAVIVMNAHDKIVNGMANVAVTTLKIVKTSSFLFVGVFAAPVAATTLGTGALA